MMTNLEKDIELLLERMKYRQDIEKYYRYIKFKKNIIYSNEDNEAIKQLKKNILIKHQIKEAAIIDELKTFDSFGIPILGMKGPFIKTEYYDSIPRVYNDLDLLINAKDAKVFYNQLKTYGYRIKKKTYLLTPHKEVI